MTKLRASVVAAFAGSAVSMFLATIAWIVTVAVNDYHVNILPLVGSVITGILFYFAIYFALSTEDA